VNARCRSDSIVIGCVIVGMLIVNGISLWTTSTNESQKPIKIEMVCGREWPGRYKHAPSACELPNGDILLAYCCGSGEYADDPAIYATRWDHCTRKWERPRVIADEPHKADANPVLWRWPDRTLWLFYVVRNGATWSTATIHAKQSRDDGKTWRNLELPFASQPMMTRCRPIELANGDFLLPVYHEAGNDTEFLPSDTCSFFLRYGTGDGKWTATQTIRSRIGNLQPAVAEVADGYVVAYCRRGGGYGDRSSGFVVRTESRDGGSTWSEGKDSNFPNPNSAVDFTRLRNGHLLLAYNHSMNRRSPLTIAISTDQDRNYPFRRNIVSGGLFDFAYPCVLQTEDGKIHVFFSADGRACIKHAVFDEADIIGG
jgi:predicted neuraminidase